MSNQNQNKVYVGNLSFRASEEELKNYLSAAGGLVSVSIIMDRETGRSKGFAFAEYESKEGMEKAIADLNGKEFLGRELRINEAKERKPQERRPRW